VRRQWRLASGSRLLVATHNHGKVREIAALLKPFGLELLSASDVGLPEPAETATSFAGNAVLKAAAAARAARLPALADDSGLEVAALAGRPGIHSARWAGPGKDFGPAMQRVAADLHARGAWSGPPRASFTAALALAWPAGRCRVVEGKVWGHLVWPPRGDKGFGYDPMFVADGQNETFGEMEPARKHAISHRARAFEAFARTSLERKRS
jgi:XTP/dITP diphosphohydrolase